MAPFADPPRSRFNAACPPSPAADIPNGPTAGTSITAMFRQGRLQGVGNPFDTDHGNGVADSIPAVTPRMHELHYRDLRPGPRPLRARMAGVFVKSHESGFAGLEDAGAYITRLSKLDQHPSILWKSKRPQAFSPAAYRAQYQLSAPPRPHPGFRSLNRVERREKPQIQSERKSKITVAKQ